MMSVSGLVPARFLALVAHFVVTVSILWSRKENVESCLPPDYSASQYDKKDTQLIVALSLTLACISLELFGFFGGLSTFMVSPGIISTSLHAAACVCLAFFVWDVWDCDLYWYIFAFCCAIPAMIETAVLIGVFGLKKAVF